MLGGSEERFHWSARDRFPDMPRGDWLHEIPRQTEPVGLTGARIPKLVTFIDIATPPASVLRIDPDDLDAVFVCDRITGWNRRRGGRRARSTDNGWRTRPCGASMRAPRSAQV